MWVCMSCLWYFSVQNKGNKPRLVEGLLSVRHARLQKVKRGRLAIGQPLLHHAVNAIRGNPTQYRTSSYVVIYVMIYRTILH